MSTHVQDVTQVPLSLEDAEKAVAYAEAQYIKAYVHAAASELPMAVCHQMAQLSYSQALYNFASTMLGHFPQVPRND